MGANRIEIAQAGCTKVGPGTADISENLFYVKFGTTVGVSRLTSRAVFCEGESLRRTVHSRGRTENQARNAHPAHSCKQDERTINVVVIIFNRLMNRFTYRLETSKVNNRVNANKCLFHCNRVANIAFNEDRAAMCDSFYAIQNGGISIGEIVIKHNVVSSLKQNNCGVRTNKAYAAG